MNWALVQTLAVGCLPLQFGLHMAILNAPMEYMGCQGVEENGQDCIPNWDPAVPSSIYAIGGLVGSSLAGPAIRKSGLRLTTVSSAGVFVLGALIIALAHSSPTLVFGRLIAGLAAGASIVVSPILVNRLAPREYRGFLGGTTQTNTNLGILISQILGIAWASNAWRKIMVAALVIALIAFGTVYFLIPQDVSAATEPATEVPETVGSIGFLLQPKYRYALVTTLSIFVVQQLTGINAIIQYGVRVLAGTMPEKSQLVNLVISIVNLVTTLVSASFIDKYGRKKLLLISLTCMGLCTAILAFSLVRGLQGLAQAFSVLTIASFAVGIGPIPFLYVSEITPAEAVGAAQSLGMVSSWLATFAVLAFFPKLNDLLGPGVIYIFSISTLLGAVWYSKWLVSDS